MKDKSFLLTEEAADFLTEHGRPTKPKTLAKKACVGGGPLFRKSGRRRIYDPRDLLAYIQAGMSQPVTSTSELGGAP